LKRVYSSFNQTAVYHARNLLEQAGIEVMVKNAALSSAMGELPPAECQAELWIFNDADQGRAEEILSQQVTASDWTCTCGENLGGQFTQCWRCGSFRSGGRAA
jgi:Putative prokaryotic signal transducing protein